MSDHVSRVQRFAPTPSARIYAIFHALLILSLALGGAACVGAVDDGASVGHEEAISGVAYEHFPARDDLERAMAHYANQPVDARARPPVSLSEFFGEEQAVTYNSRRLRIELLRSDAREVHEPLAFLHARYGFGTQKVRYKSRNLDATQNDRSKDVRLYHLAKSLQSPASPFPEAALVRPETEVEAQTQDGAVLVRIWTDFHSLTRCAPADLPAKNLLRETARMGVWAYVAGNMDGPAINANNAGFARFKDPSGRLFWRGVLIDNGGTFTLDGDHSVDQWRDRIVKPWNMNLLHQGPIERENIPRDVIDNILQIERDSEADLSVRLQLDVMPNPRGAAMVKQLKTNAREVIDHYQLQ
ncbi:MAG: hypothetical protein NVS3B20_21230 [Polyangiales bacterium]